MKINHKNKNSDVEKFGAVDKDFWISVEDLLMRNKESYNLY